MDALIIGRAICGVGGAGMYLGVMTLLSVTTTEHERPTYIGFTGLTWGAGTVLGPIIGGAFTESSATWRWVSCLRELFPAWQAAKLDNHLGLLHQLGGSCDLRSSVLLLLASL